MNPLPTELPRALCPLPVTLLLADVANLVCLLRLVTVHALVPSRYHEIVEALQFLLAYPALNAVLAQEELVFSMCCRCRLSTLASFQLPTNLVKHVMTLGAGNVLLS